MKVAQITLDLWRGSTGVATTVANFASAVRSLGCELSTISFDRDVRDPSERPLSTRSVQCVTLPGFRRYGFAMGKQLGPIRDQVASADAVMIHSLYGYHFDWTIRHLRDDAVPCFVVPHGALRDYCFTYRRMRKQMWLLSKRRFLQDRAIWIFSSHYERLQAERHVFSKGSCVMYWPVDERFWRHDDGTPAPVPAQRERVLLLVGRLHPMKRTIETVSAFARLRPRGWSLQSAGQPSDQLRVQDVRAAAGDLWNTSIVYLGSLGMADLATLYRKASALVLYSAGENFANVVAEALVNGCFVSVSDDVGLAEYVTATGHGLTSRIQTERDIEAALLQVISLGDFDRDTASQTARTAFSSGRFRDSVERLLTPPRLPDL